MPLELLLIFLKILKLSDHQLVNGYINHHTSLRIFD